MKRIKCCRIKINVRPMISLVMQVLKVLPAWAVVQEQVAPQTLNKQGDLDTAELAKVLNLSSFRLQSAAPLEKTG